MAQRAGWQSLYAIQQNTVTAGVANYAREYPRFRVGAADSVGDIGILGIGGNGLNLGKFQLDLTGQPHLAPTAATLETERTVGLSQRYSIEYDQTAAQPMTFTIETPADAFKLSLFLWLLCQNGSVEDLTGTVLTAKFTPYTDPDIEQYCSVVRLMDDSIATLRSADTTSHIAMGCICTELTLSANEGGLLTLSATMMGMEQQRYNTLGKIRNSPRLQHYPIATGSTVIVKHNGVAFAGTCLEVANEAAFTAPGATNVQWSLAEGYLNFAAADLVTYDGQYITIDVNPQDDVAWSALGGFALKDPLKWQDATIKMGGTTYVNSNAINLPGFSLTLRNGAVPKFYDNDYVTKYVLGRFEGEGEIRIPWGTATEGGNAALNDFVDGTDNLLYIVWGDDETAVNDAEFSLVLNIRHTDVDVSGDVEIETGANFKCVYDGTNDAFTARCGYTQAVLDRGMNATPA